MKRVLKWAAVVLVVLAIAGFLAFLYFLPPFFLIPAETFARDVHEAAPGVSDIADPAQRVIAERGRYIVVRSGCIGCHAMNGPQGPDYTKYLAGGGLRGTNASGTFVSRNLTPDPETGLARRSDDEVKRILRSGVFPDGHVVPHTIMPWANFSRWSEEDRYAVLVYLRNLKPVRHRIPDADFTPVALPPGALDRDFGAKDYGVK